MDKQADDREMIPMYQLAHAIKNKMTANVTFQHASYHNNSINNNASVPCITNIQLVFFETIEDTLIPVLDIVQKSL